MINWDKIKDDWNSLKEKSKELETVDSEEELDKILDEEKREKPSYLEPDQTKYPRKEKDIQLHFVVQIDDRERVFSFIKPEKVEDLLQADDDLGEFLTSLVEDFDDE